MALKYKGKNKGKIIIKQTGKSMIVEHNSIIENLTKQEEEILLKDSDFELIGTSEEVIKKKIKKKEGGG